MFIEGSIVCFAVWHTFLHLATGLREISGSLEEVGDPGMYMFLLKSTLPFAFVGGHVARREEEKLNQTFTTGPATLM